MESQYIPPEVQAQYIAGADYANILRFCSQSQEHRGLCNSREFWIRKINIDLKSTDINTYFIAAARQGQTIIVSLLLSKDDDITHIEELDPNHRQGTALVFAAFYGYTTIVKLLLEDGRCNPAADLKHVPYHLRGRLYSDGFMFDSLYYISNSRAHDVAVYEDHFDIADLIRSDNRVVVDRDRIAELSAKTALVDEYRKHLSIPQLRYAPYSSRDLEDYIQTFSLGLLEEFDGEMNYDDFKQLFTPRAGEEDNLKLAKVLGRRLPEYLEEAISRKDERAIIDAARLLVLMDNMWILRDVFEVIARADSDSRKILLEVYMNYPRKVVEFAITNDDVGILEDFADLISLYNDEVCLMQVLPRILDADERLSQAFLDRIPDDLLSAVGFDTSERQTNPERFKSDLRGYRRS